MITLTLFEISTLITALVSLFFGLFVYFTGEKTKLKLSWLLNSIVISAWSIGLFGVVFSKISLTAWLWQYVLDICGICVPLLYLNFLLYLIKKQKQFIFLQFFSLASATSLIILNFTPLFKTGISPKLGVNFWIDPGILYIFFPLYFVFLVSIAMFVVVKEYYISPDKDRKMQMVYVLIAQVLGFGGAMTDFFPQLFNVYPFGNYFIILYVIFISYAAMKHHLFDMRIIAAELLTFVIWVFLLIRFLFSATYSDYWVNGIVLAVVIAAGILLIRSVINEVRQKEQIEKIEKEIEQAYAVEKKANEELKNLDKVKNQFLMQVQHDLRTPLGIFRDYCELLLNGAFGKQPPKASETIHKMRDLAQSKINQVNTFLDLTQFQLGKGVVLSKKQVDLFALLKEIVSELKGQADSKGVALILEDEPGPMNGNIDREKLKAAIFNIVDNCLKYTAKGSVKAEINKNNGNLMVVIKDTGIGIPADKVKNLFDAPYERSQQAKEMSVSGKGIGLYLSAQIIRAHGGKVWAESEGVGKGSTFYIELPNN